MQFTPLLSHTTTRPHVSLPVFVHNLVRDQLSIQTWLLLGASIQTLIFLLPLRPMYQYTPSLFFLLITLVNNLIQLSNVRHSSYMTGRIPGKHAAIFPNADGSFTREDSTFPGGEQLAVFMLNVKSNHPLGALAPGFSNLYHFFQSMMADLNDHAAEYGYLGEKQWLNADERSTSSELMTVFYFRDLASVHKFAHGEKHREGWDWWSKHAKEHPFLGLSHEAYEVPVGNWENIYINLQPSGFGSVRVPVKGEEGTKWVSTVVDANRGKLRTHTGRKGETSGTENQEKYGAEVDPYDERVG